MSFKRKGWVVFVILFTYYGCVEGSGGGDDETKIAPSPENKNPTIELNCPSSIGEHTATSCAITVSDVDGPSPLTCQLNSVTSCEDITLTGCLSVSIPPQGENAGSGSCEVVVNVYDSFNPPATNEGRAEILITEENSSPVFSFDCLLTVGENTDYFCDFTVLDSDIPPQSVTCSLNHATTCSEVIIDGCNSVSFPAQGEEAGPGTCEVVLDIQDNYNPPAYLQISHSYTIEEENDTPYLIVDCPSAVEENYSTTCNLLVSDADIPPQNLYCSLNVSTTCVGATISGCNTVNIPPQGEGMGVRLCDVMVNVEDDFNPPAIGQGNDSISIIDDNQNPSVSLTCPVSAPENAPFSCTITATDPDLPEQGLTCSLGDATTCNGVTISGCNTINVTSQGEATTGCFVEVEVRDDYTPAGTAENSASIAITEVNENPTITLDCPTNIGENSSTTCVLAVSDSDIPTQPLNCAIDAFSTCNGVTIVGCEVANIPPQGEGSNPRTCDVVVNVADNFSPAGTGQDSQTITLEEEHLIPQWVSLPTDIGVPLSSSYTQINGYAIDGDMPNTNPTDPGFLTCVKTSQTCSFPVDVSGTGEGAVNCEMSFSSGATPEICNVNIQVSDGSGLLLTHSITIRTMNVLYVDADAMGAETGLSWEDAFTHPQDAVNVASEGQMIWVAEGTYYRPLGGTEPVLTLKDGIQIYGGFAGTESSFSERGNPADFPTILDGEYMSGHTVIGANNTIIDGFTIKRGGTIATGGGIYLNNVSGVTIENCIIAYNHAYYGGGIYSSNSSYTVDNSVIMSNLAWWFEYRPEVCEYRGLPPDCENFYETFGEGGGIYNLHSNLTITNTTISYNESGDTGGGIHSEDSSLVISDSSIDHNTARKNGWLTCISPWEAVDGAGGGLYHQGGVLHITDSTIANNSSVDGGGILYSSSQPSSIERTSFIDNYAKGSFICFGYHDTGRGGGIYGSKKLDLTNCLFMGNEAVYGGGVATIGTIKNSTFTNNHAEGWEGPYYNEHCCASIGSGGGVADASLIINSIVWGNTANTTSPYPGDIVDSPNIYYSNVGQLGIMGEGNISTDPLFLSDSDPHLQNSSPCIDSGTSIGAPADDLDGKPRPYGRGIDMGAYEHQGPLVCEDTVDNDGDTYIDWTNDPGCDNAFDLTEYGLHQCDDNSDNDGDTYIDYLDDPGCVSVASESERQGGICDDGIDNDGDTFADYPDDHSCQDPFDTTESETNECDDNTDNDADTLVDTSDPGCLFNPNGLTEIGECQDGMDNDGDTLTDWQNDPQCSSIFDNKEQFLTDCDYFLYTRTLTFPDHITTSFSGSEPILPSSNYYIHDYQYLGRVGAPISVGAQIYYYPLTATLSLYDVTGGACTIKDHVDSSSWYEEQPLYLGISFTPQAGHYYVIVVGHGYSDTSYDLYTWDSDNFDQSLCGNDWCEPWEPDTCSQDCSHCGNGICEVGEEVSCPSDCPYCGNGICEFGENSYWCPSDCWW